MDPTISRPEGCLEAHDSANEMKVLKGLELVPRVSVGCDVHLPLADIEAAGGRHDPWPGRFRFLGHSEGPRGHGGLRFANLLGKDMDYWDRELPLSLMVHVQFEPTRDTWRQGAENDGLIDSVVSPQLVFNSQQRGTVTDFGSTDP